MRIELQEHRIEIDHLIQENVPLSQFTTLQIGGPARYFIRAATAESLASAVSWAKSRDLPFFVLGGGSNVLIADSGFPGLIIQIDIRGIRINQTVDTVTITAGAGEEWDAFVKACVEKNWAGLECLSGIPGRIGATPIQNVGAYGQEVSETIVSVTALDTGSGQIVEIEASDCEFGYRTSRFKIGDRDRFIITRVTYRLRPNGAPAIRYAELQRYLSSAGKSEPSLIDVREAVLTIRRRKAMVLDPADIDSRSVGSFFVNPVVTNEEFEQIKTRARRRAPQGADMPFFAAADGKIKLSAAWLIEQSGFPRGYVFGNAGLSSKHALAIINRNGATAREISELATRIISDVKDKFGVNLIPEPVFVGSELKNHNSDF